MSGDDNDDHVNDCSDDIYIMMKCLSVCASRKIITSHFRAECHRREVSRLLGQPCPSDDDDDDNDDGHNGNDGMI